MRRIVHSHNDINISEYTRDWHKYAAFEICFVFFFAFLLSQVDLDAIYGIITFNKLNTIGESVDWLVDVFINGTMQVLYMGFIAIAMNMAVFFTVRPDNVWRKSLRVILDRNLLIFLLCFSLLFLCIWLEINGPPLLKIVLIMTMQLISVGTLTRYVWSRSRWFKLASVVVTMSAGVWSWHSHNTDATLNKGMRILFHFAFEMNTVLIANVYLLMFMFICYLIVSTMLMELKSAQAGKAILYRKLLLAKFLDSVEGVDRSLERLKKWRYSEKLFKYVIYTVFRIKVDGMSFYTKLKLIESFSRIDLSLIYPAYLTKYIQFRNRTNLMLSLLFTGNSLAIVLFVLPYTSRKREAIVILLVILFSRLLSRTVEVGYAFSRDVLSSQSKASSLTGADRVKLAVTSIVEIAVTSTAFYFLYDHLGKLNYVVKPFEAGYAGYLSATLGSYLEALFNGAAIAVFNISYPMGSFVFTMLVHLIQVLNSVILITLSIANYLNMKKDVHMYVSEQTQDGVIVWYASLQDDGQVIRRKAATGRDEEEIKRSIMEKWHAKEINDSEYKELLACITEKPSQINDGYQVRKMTIGQLDNYVTETLRGGNRKDNRLRIWN